MNGPQSTSTFVPKQALSPTPELYDELVADGMEQLAKASLQQIPPIADGSVIHDNGCGTGAGTAAMVASLVVAEKDTRGSPSSPPPSSATVSIIGSDINADALAIYRAQAAEKKWPVTGAVEMDSTALRSFADGTFTHSLSNAFLFVLPTDESSIAAIRETHRTLKPNSSGTAIFNSWAYIPNMAPISSAATATRPPGTPLPRQGLDKWADPTFLRSTIQKGGFRAENIKVVQSEVFVTTKSEFTRFATMLWSFVGGTGAAGWLASDEERWDEAVEIVKEGLRETEKFELIDGGKGGVRLRFVANIAVATK